MLCGNVLGENYFYLADVVASAEEEEDSLSTVEEGVEVEAEEDS